MQIAFVIEVQDLSQRSEHPIVEEGIPDRGIAHGGRTEIAAIFLPAGEVAALRSTQSQIVVARIGVRRDAWISWDADIDEIEVGERWPALQRA